MKRFSLLLIFLAAPLAAWAQTCPSGTTPLPWGVTRDPTTDLRREIFCKDKNGNIIASFFQSMVSNSIRFAEQFAGADLGAKINAADADLGANPGEIWVTSSGTLTTVVSLSSNHTLRFLGNITVTMPTTIQVASGKSDIGIYCDSGATLLNTQTGYNGGAQDNGHIRIGFTGYAPSATTTVTVTAAAGSTSLTVTSSAGFNIGDEIKLNDTRYNEWNQIAGVPDGTHLTRKSVV